MEGHRRPRPAHVWRAGLSRRVTGGASTWIGRRSGSSGGRRDPASRHFWTSTRRRRAHAARDDRAGARRARCRSRARIVRPSLSSCLSARRRPDPTSANRDCHGRCPDLTRPRPSVVGPPHGQMAPRPLRSDPAEQPPPGSRGGGAQPAYAAFSSDLVSAGAAVRGQRGCGCLRAVERRMSSRRAPAAPCLALRRRRSKRKRSRVRSSRPAEHCSAVRVPAFLAREPGRRCTSPLPAASHRLASGTDREP